MKHLIAVSALLFTLCLLAPTPGSSFHLRKRISRPAVPGFIAGYAGYWRWNHRIQQWVWVSTVRIRPARRRVVIRTF